jgi:hypothetical protein
MVGLGHDREHLLEVPAVPGWSFVALSAQIRVEQYHGTAIRARELSDQTLVGGHAERLIIAPDDHPNRGGHVHQAPGRGRETSLASDTSQVPRQTASALMI